MIRLVLTCGACPEQYDAYLVKEKGQAERRVGYLRLRHGHFKVLYPDVGGEIVYEASPKGDGIFDDDERDYYLRFAVDAIQRKLAGESLKPEAPNVEYELEGEAKWP